MELEMKSQHTSLLLLAIISFQICLTEQLSTPAFPPEYNEFSGSLYAACRMRPNTKLAPGMPRVYGRVLFKQQGADGKLKVSLKLHGFEATDQHLRAIHIHQYGDLGEGCTSTGGHYNPFDVNHPGHPGDFGNFAPQNGRIQRMIDSTATLLGPKSVLGRAVVIHEKEDDLGRGGDAGSLLHGNAGARLACCVIGISKARQKEQG